jgi:hypothetical protein
MRSWVISVLCDTGSVCASVDESSREIALRTARRASDSRDNQVSIRGCKGATKVEEFPSGRVIARFIEGQRL